MPKLPALPKSPKRQSFDRAFALLPPDVQERVLAFVYAALIERRDRLDNTGEVGEVLCKQVQEIVGCVLAVLAMERIYSSLPACFIVACNFFGVS